MGILREEFSAEYARAAGVYASLGITKVMEKAVIEHLVAIHAASTCYGSGADCDSSKCNDPDRPNCTQTTTHNCICTQ